MTKKTSVIVVALLTLQTLLLGGLLAVIISRESGEAAVARAETENRLNTLDIGIQRGYVEAMFGAPIYRADMGDAEVTYYKLNGAVLRVDYDSGGAAVGYLITITDGQAWALDGYGFYSDGGTLGTAPYSAMKTAHIEANGGGNSLGQVFYAEYSDATTATGGNYIVQAYMPYGSGDGTGDLIFIEAEPQKYLSGYERGGSLLGNGDYEVRRGEYRPNTYGEFRYEPTAFAFSEDAYRLLTGEK
jgi:hypothetical protein